MLVKMYSIIPYLVLACLSSSSQAAFQVPDQLKDGVHGNPGIQTCIRHNFLPPISSLFGHLVDTEIQKLALPDTTVKLPLVTRGAVTLNKMKFTFFKSASHHSLAFAPPNQTEWISTDLHYNISGQFGTTAEQLFSSAQTSGAIQLAAKNATVMLRTHIRAGKNGKQQLEMISCKANFTYASVSTQASGFFGGLFKWFQSVLTASAHIILERVTCDTAQYYIESVLNDVFQNEIPNSLSISGDQDAKAKPLLPHELILNYSLLRDTKVYGNCLAMQMHGEVSWLNKSATPFDPPRLNFSTKLTNDHMLDIWASDYVMNSLLYHANEHGVFDVILNDKTPEWEINLQSQCEKDGAGMECIGLALPEISDPSDFPKQIVELHLKPSNGSHAPFIIFQEETPAGMVSDMIIDLFLDDVKGERKNAITAEVRVHSIIHRIKLTPATVFFELTKSNATVKIQEDQLFLPPSALTQRSQSLGVFMADLVEKLINSKLAEGVPLPKIKGMKFVKTEAVLLKRTMNIAADVEFDKKFWLHAASEARTRAQAKAHSE